MASNPPPPHDPRRPAAGLGPGVFGHRDGRLDVMERSDRFQVFARLPETDADDVRVTFEQGALTILARREGVRQPMGWGVRLVFGDAVVGEVTSVLEGELLLVELPKVPDAGQGAQPGEAPAPEAPGDGESDGGYDPYLEQDAALQAWLEAEEAAGYHMGEGGDEADESWGDEPEELGPDDLGFGEPGFGEQGLGEPGPAGPDVGNPWWPRLGR